VISVGGDGTLNAIATGLIGSKMPLGMVPMGSGNGYVRSLGLPLDPLKALHHAFTGGARWMDVCYLNDIPFLGTAGIGFDARVAAQFDVSHSRGLLGYAKIIIRDIINAPPMKVRVEVNGKRQECEVLMLVFCNTREFGNKAVISPNSTPWDGVAELRVVSKPSIPGLVRAFIQIYTGRADNSRHIRNISCTEATVWQEGVLAHLDGEPMEIGHDIRFRLERERLCVVV
jgi:diacylglycerol kinase (ATP)